VAYALSDEMEVIDLILKIGSRGVI